MKCHCAKGPLVDCNKYYPVSNALVTSQIGAKINKYLLVIYLNGCNRAVHKNHLTCPCDTNDE